MEQLNNQTPAISVALIRGVHAQSTYYNDLLDFSEKHISQNLKQKIATLIVFAAPTEVSESIIKAMYVEHNDTDRSYHRVFNSFESFAKIACCVDNTDYLYQECMENIEVEQENIFHEFKMLRQRRKEAKGSYVEQICVDRALAVGDMVCGNTFRKVLQFILENIRTPNDGIEKIRTESCIKIYHRKQSAQFHVDVSTSEGLIQSQVKTEKRKVYFATGCVGFFEEKGAKIPVSLGPGGSIDTASIMATALRSREISVFHPKEYARKKNDAHFVCKRAREYGDVKISFNS